MKLNIKGFEVLVDDEDFDLIKNHKWHTYKHRNTRYVRRAIYRPGKNPASQSLHRFLMNAGKGQVVDHENRNGLDCRRKNLRFVTNSGNGLNSVHPRPKFDLPTGVTEPRPGRFYARITENGNRRYLGVYNSPEEAGAAYKKAYDNQILKEIC